MFGLRMQIFILTIYCSLKFQQKLNQTYNQQYTVILQYLMRRWKRHFV